MDLLWRMLLLKIPSPVEVYVMSGVVGCVWTISMRVFLEKKIRAPNYAYITLARKFCIVVHSTKMGPLIGVFFNGVLLGSYDYALR